MCGIVGYVGKETSNFLLEGLQRLEYRGYDSAGIAVIEKEKLKIHKQPGKLKQLLDSLGPHPSSAALGIGHTRWATHGHPCERNAHPHTDCKEEIAVVHNGIIENYQELKDRLIRKKHRFHSDTDTEVLAHLIEEEMNGSLEEAVRQCLKKVKGTYALGAVSTKDPHKLVAARFGSPLILGLSHNAYYIASDVPALLDKTKDVIYPDDGEILTITQEGYRITDLNNKVKEHPVHKIEWSIDQVAKGGFEKFMLKEIHEQPAVVSSILSRRIQKNKILFEELNLDPKILKETDRVFIVACGTAFHAGFYLKYFMEQFINIGVEIDIASEFRYRNPKLSKKTLIITISQSGETADTLASLRTAKAKGCTILSICNVVGSSIARESHGVIYTHAGPEIGVASTKAYTAQMLIGVLWALYFTELRGEISLQKLKSILSELRMLPKKMTFHEEAKCASIAAKYARAESALYLGRSFNYPSALEGALKNKEISYMHAEGHAAGEMKHGPIALIDNKLPVFCICPQGKSYEKMISNIREVEARDGQIIAIATEKDKTIQKIVKEVVFIPEISEALSPLLVAIPLQLLAYFIAAEKGCEIDQPRNLAKSVTVE